jgi:hypothetical protein
MPGARITLDEAVEISRTGDLWLFRGAPSSVSERGLSSAAADRAVRVFTNAPVNHVGMAVVLDDLPPLMWHAELGRSLPDVWTGTTQRGAQLHDLRDAVTVWSARYRQEAWLRQLDARITRDMEDALLRSIARLDGTPFPSTAAMAGKWLAARLPRRGTDRAVARSAYCAEVVAKAYQAMGLLPGGRSAAFYDPGRFWSGDGLELIGEDVWLSAEIEVQVPAGNVPGELPAAPRV